jgi:hypothetical protein
VWVVLLCLALGASSAAGQDAQPEDDTRGPLRIRTDPWVFEIEPLAWYVSPGGELTMPGSPPGSGDVDVSTLNLDSPRLSPGGEIHMWSGDWRFGISGFYFSADGREFTAESPGSVGSVSFAAGDTVSSSMEFWAAEATVGKAVRLPKRLAGDPNGNFSATLEVLGGLRFYGLDFGFSTAGAQTSHNEFAGHPLVGAKLSMDIYQKVFTVDVQLDIGYWADGGDQSVLGYDILVGFTWRPVPNAGIQIGYRDLAVMMESGSGSEAFEYNGALQGLYAGATIRF